MDHGENSKNGRKQSFNGKNGVKSQHPGLKSGFPFSNAQVKEHAFSCAAKKKY